MGQKSHESSQHTACILIPGQSSKHFIEEQTQESGTHTPEQKASNSLSPLILHLCLLQAQRREEHKNKKEETCTSSRRKDEGHNKNTEKKEDSEQASRTYPPTCTHQRFNERRAEPKTKNECRLPKSPTAFIVSTLQKLLPTLVR